MIGETQKKINRSNEQITILNKKIENDNKLYTNTSKILGNLNDESKNLKKAKELLETISKHPEGIQIIHELEVFKQQLSKISDAQKPEDIIKMGRYSISYNKNTPQQLKEGEGKRTAEFTQEFGYEFSTPPKVFVSLATIDADSSKHIRISVYVQKNKYNNDEYLIQKDKFTFAVTTWNNSKIYGVDVAWIAIGKPKQ